MKRMKAPTFADQRYNAKEMSIDYIVPASRKEKAQWTFSPCGRHILIHQTK